MAAERQRTDLETLLQLCHFCKKVSPRPARLRGPPSGWEAGTAQAHARRFARCVPQPIASVLQKGSTA